MKYLILLTFLVACGPSSTQTYQTSAPTTTTVSKRLPNCPKDRVGFYRLYIYHMDVTLWECYRSLL